MLQAHGADNLARFRQLRIAVLETQPASREQLVSTIAEVGIEGPLRENVVALIGRTGCDAALVGIDAADATEIELTPTLDCPLVLCSGNAGPETILAAQKIGAMAFLLKPIRPEQLKPTLE